MRWESDNTIATPPGLTIKEQLENKNMNQKEFAARMGLSEKHISKLINGEVTLTFDVARKLETVLGPSIQFWLNLENIYREKIEIVKYENELNKEKELAKKFPYPEMVSKGWIEKATKGEEKVLYLRRFFEVASLTSLLEKELYPLIVYRRVDEREKSSLIAWAQKAKIEAREVETSKINLKSLEKSVVEIRSMTVLNPTTFSQRLKNVLASSGVALILLPQFKGTFLHGATFIDKNKIVIALTLRGNDADKFWFSLFHEIGHILMGHIYSEVEISEEEELKANEYAENILIPPDEFNKFVQRGDFSEQAILEFSNSINIDPGIVVGRLQIKKYIEFSWHNNLKTRYELIEPNNNSFTK